ncbi:MAG: dephospho-CoA kinase [Gemmatimonadota bacterium]
MIRVGLTGTVAAGKSTVGRLFETWGANRVDADQLARTAVAPGSPGLAKIRAMWGDGVLQRDGSLDREVVRARVFGDDDAREALEEIVHREVRRLRAEWRARQDELAASVIVEEIPLLFETGLETGYDAVVVVDAAVEERRRRAVAFRGWTPEEFDAIDATQLPAEEKRARADHVILNDGDRAALESASRAVWDELRRGSRD